MKQRFQELGIDISLPAQSVMIQQAVRRPDERAPPPEAAAEPAEAQASAEPPPERTPANVRSARR